MIPTTSLSPMRKETFFRAQMISFLSARFRKEPRKKFTRRSRNMVSWLRAPSSYFLDRSSTTIASLIGDFRASPVVQRSSSDDIGKGPFRLAKVERSDDEHKQGDDRRRADKRQVHLAIGNKAGAESFNEPRQRVQRENLLESLRKKGCGINDRGDEEPNLNQKRDGIFHVAIAHIHGRQQHAHTKDKDHQAEDKDRCEQ